MRATLLIQATRPWVRDWLFFLGFIVLAVYSPVAAVGQSNYAMPYTFTTIAGGVLTFYRPYGLAVDTNGNVYVADTYHSAIQEVTPAGVVILVAGQLYVDGTNDGTGTAAQFSHPQGIAVDGAGNLYVADTFGNTIRKVTPVGTNWAVTTLAGLPTYSGTNDGTGSAARFSSPVGIAVDTNGNIYVTDTPNDTVRKVTPVGTNWVVTTLAGQPGIRGSNDGTNGVARFNRPSGVLVDANGNIYVADTYNSVIREMTPAGTNWVVTTIAGMAPNFGTADGTNGAAQFGLPYGLAMDGEGNLYMTDSYFLDIRKLTPEGTNWVSSTLAGPAPGTAPPDEDGTGTNAGFDYPQGVAVDNQGNVYVADAIISNIRKGFPASSVPAPVLQPPGINAGQFGFGITGLPNLAVEVQASSNFIDWQVVGAYYVLTGGSNFYSGPSPPQGNQFYRVHVR